MEPKVMSDWASKDPRSFKAWKAGTDDGRVAKFAAWAKRHPGLSEEGLVNNYRDSRPTLANRPEPSKQFSLVERLVTVYLAPIVGLLVGTWLVSLFS